MKSQHAMILVWLNQEEYLQYLQSAYRNKAPFCG